MAEPSHPILRRSRGFLQHGLCCSQPAAPRRSDHPSPRQSDDSSSVQSNRNTFNPVVALRRYRSGTNDTYYDLFYNREGGTSLHPLPGNVSEFYLRTGLHRLLKQLEQMIIHALGGSTANSPASNSAIEAMPTITISSSHIRSRSHCAVCTDPFVIGCKAREMPCEHIFHHDCILPWLSDRNTCPVCRQEMPLFPTAGTTRLSYLDMSALTIWSLQAGRFAVGRYSGSGVRNRYEDSRELSEVYTELDGGIFRNIGGFQMGEPRLTRTTRTRQRTHPTFFQRIFGCFGPLSENAN